MNGTHERHAQLRKLLADGSDEVAAPTASFRAKRTVVRFIGRLLMHEATDDGPVSVIDDHCVRHGGLLMGPTGPVGVGVAIPIPEGRVDRSFDAALTRLAEVRCRQFHECLYDGPLGEFLTQRTERVSKSPSFGSPVQTDGRGIGRPTADIVARLATLVSFGFELPDEGFALPPALRGAGICYWVHRGTVKIGVHRAVGARQVRGEALSLFASVAEEELSASLEALPGAIRDRLMGQQPEVSVSTYWTNIFDPAPFTSPDVPRPVPSGDLGPGAAVADWAVRAAVLDTDTLLLGLRDPMARPEACRAFRTELARRGVSR